MNFETDIISTKNYFLRTLVSKGFLVVAAISLVLVLDRNLEGGLLEVFNAPLYMYLMVWGWIIIAVSLSIYFGSQKYKLGKIALTFQGVQIAFPSKDINELFLYTHIEVLRIVLNTDVSRSKYSRGVLDGGRNRIEFTHQNRSYKYEFFLQSIAKDSELDAALKEIANYMRDSKLEIRRNTNC